MNNLLLKERQLEDVLVSENIHRCRIHPFEATIYVLNNEDDRLDVFRANAKAELILQVEDSSPRQTKKRKEYSSFEIQLNFSEESVSRVTTELTSSYWPKLIF